MSPRSNLDAAFAAHARGAGINIVEGPLAAGWAAAAPYDVLLIDGDAPALSAALIAQLREGGRVGMVLIGEDGVGRATAGRVAGGHFGGSSSSRPLQHHCRDLKRPRASYSDFQGKDSMNSAIARRIANHTLPLAMIALALGGTPLRADTLAAALASAYETNPELQAQRAITRQVDETVPQALSGYRPGIGASVGFDANGDNFNDSGQVFTAGGQITQPIYTGGQTKAAVSASENSLAARAQLRAAENTVMVNVVSAYANVLALQRVVELTTNQVKVLSRELQASKDRFEVGDLTRTDVAQSEARLARLQSQLIAAQGTLTLARESYRQVVGRLPVDLAPMPLRRPCPARRHIALSISPIATTRR